MNHSIFKILEMNTNGSILLLILLFAVAQTSTAQNLINHKGTRIPVDTSKWALSGVNLYNKNIGTVGIGTTSAADNNAALEVKATNKGMLIPRVSLSSKSSTSPLTAHVAGMLVYNTATAGTVPNNVSPGFYYNTGAAWARVMEQSSAPTDTTNDGWKEDAGNTQVRLAYRSDGLTARTTGTEFVIADNGRVGIGTPAPASTFEVKGSLASSVNSISAATTLNESHSYIVMNSGSSITLPAAATCPGRVYHIRNASGTTKTISLSGTTTTLTNNRTMTCISDGTIWHRFGTAP
ncbi:MAG: hypothetical protein JNL13_02030 [Chitinophagaceae bacterium]|nr:hypothetical protein [Chitinophagaceae bacterium]